MEPYLKSTEIIDWQHPAVLEQAGKLAAGVADPVEIARRCFEWVRDEIRHSWDFRLNPVTCAASEVLEAGTGYCYAKSHLLAALLRANAIPAGLCYQRLSRDGKGAPYCLHGLNAIHLPGFGWYRVDARGNKPGVDARFEPPLEHLAFSTDGKVERDLAEIWPEPLPVVVEALRAHRTCEALYQNLPDVQVLGALIEATK